MGKDQAARLLPFVNNELFDRFVEFIEDEYQRTGTQLDRATEVRDIRNLQGKRELLRYLSRLRDHVNDASRR
jgi:hypothetical protein